MMKYVTLLLLIVVAIPLAAQTVSDSLISAAIEAGRKDDPEFCFGYAVPSSRYLGSSWGTMLWTPYSRIVSKAHDAAEKFREFSEDSLTPEDLDPRYMLYVAPPRDITDIRADLEGAIVKVQDAIFRPDSSAIDVVEYQNAFGATAQGSVRRFYFSPSLFAKTVTRKDAKLILTFSGGGNFERGMTGFRKCVKEAGDLPDD